MLGAGQAFVARPGAVLAQLRRQSLGAAHRQAEGRDSAPGALHRAEDVLLGVGAVRHLRGDVEPLGEQGDRRLVVLDRLRLLRAAAGDAPENAGQQAVAARAGQAGVRVEVVPVGAEHAGEAVGGIGDLDLHPGQAPGEEGAEDSRAPDVTEPAGSPVTSGERPAASCASSRFSASR